MKMETSIVEFFNQQIDLCKHNGSFGTARNYQRTLNSLTSFLQGEDIPLSSVNEKLVTDYELWLAGKGMNRNSSSFYIRNFRSVYNKAVKHNLTEQSSPFRNVYTGIDKTRKRAVNESTILRLLKLDLSHSPSLALTRDLFVFSYCTRGMAFVDIAFLRKSDISYDIINYIRRKTGQQLSVRIEPCMARIIRRHASATRNIPYVFPIVSSIIPEEAYRQYQIALNYHNRKLKRIAKLLKGNPPLSFYAARHTWATTARNHNVPLSVISEGMGHTNEKTTRIYLASLENSIIDKANRGIVARLNSVVSM